MIYRNKSPLLSNLPDELLLIILENLQPHDLWSMSQTSKRFVQMPDAILMRKFFKQCTVRFSWCCTFCLIQAAPPPSLSNIVPLFQSSQLEVTEPQGLWNEVKAFVMETTILTFFDEWECQRCNLAIGSESIQLRIKDLYRLRISRPTSLQKERRRFLKYFFSELRKAKSRSATVSFLLWVRHRLAPIPPMFFGAIIFSAGATLIIGYCTYWAVLDLLIWPFRALNHFLKNSRWWQEMKGDGTPTVSI